MANFFAPTRDNLQPTAQEGVLSTLRQASIDSFVAESNVGGAPATLTIAAAATATGPVVTTYTVNPNYYPYITGNVFAVTTNVLSGDTTAIVAQKTALAFNQNFDLGSFFEATVVGAVISITRRQSGDINATLLAPALAPAQGVTATSVASVASTIAPTMALGRLVYSPNNGNEQTIRILDAAASGVIRGFTMWNPEVEFGTLTKTLSYAPELAIPVISEGILTANIVTPITAYPAAAAGVFVYTSGINQGRIRFSADVGAVALNAVNFPNLHNAGGVSIQLYSFTANSPLAKILVGV
jgi:hypothetical protein